MVCGRGRVDEVGWFKINKAHARPLLEAWPLLEAAEAPCKALHGTKGWHGNFVISLRKEIRDRSIKPGMQKVRVGTGLLCGRGGLQDMCPAW